jgi:hypothetical protein
LAHISELSLLRPFLDAATMKFPTLSVACLRLIIICQIESSIPIGQLTASFVTSGDSAGGDIM